MLAWLHRGRWGWCALVAAVAAALYLPNLDSLGFWDPYELDVADRAAGDAPRTGTPFTAWLVARGFAAFGAHELGGRLPLALVGIAIAIATFVWVRAAFGSRCAVLASLFAIASPLLVSQSRQLTGSIGVTFGHLMIVAGGSAAIWARGVPARIGGVAAACVGAACAYYSAGALLGIAVPAAALCAGCASARRHHLAVALGAIAVGAAVCALTGAAAFGRIRPSPAYQLSWGATAEQVAFGAFPWIALLPAGVGCLLRARGDRAAFTSQVAIAWAALAFVACAAVDAGPGRLGYPAIPALAVAAAVWLDAVVALRERVTSGAIAFAVGVVAVVGRDLAELPDRIATLHIAGPAPAHAGSVGALSRAPLVAALSVAGCLIAVAALRAWPRRVAAAAIVTSSVAFGTVVAFAWLPAVAHNTSNLHLFDRYRDLRRPGEVLAVMPRWTRAAGHYAPDHAPVRTPHEVVDLFAGDERAFALIASSSLCTVSQRSRAAGREVVVLDDSEAAALVSNLHRTGEPRAVGLDDAIGSRPPSPGRPVSAELEGQLELLGVDMPASVRRGATFTITLYYRVIARPKRAWTVFLHFDRRGLRFQGDHPPVGGRCATNEWNPGDYIADRHRMSAGDITFPKGTYDVWTGLFVGGNGKWTNMTAVGDRVDDADRVHLGTLEVR